MAKLSGPGCATQKESRVSVLQFLRILWARKLLIAATTVSCLIGAWVITLILPPRWDAHARVMLNLLKPDLITGEVMGTGARTYVATQQELITDYSVAGQVPEQVGWTSDPNLIAAYQRRSKNDIRDFRPWLAQIVIDNTRTELLEGSNILQITYTGTAPTQAKAVADALRQSYLDASLAFRRNEANRNADWYQAQAEKIRAALNAAQAAEADFERKNGVVLEGNKDLETARLQALSTVGAAPVMESAAASSNTQAELAALDPQIALARQRLGPNHPELQAMIAKRTALAAVIARDKTAQGGAAGAAAAQAAAIDRALENQKARVINQSGKIGELQQLQVDVDTKLDQYNKTLARVAELRQEAAAADTGITALGVATTGKQPSFPNYLLVFGGAGGLGLGLGFLAALLAELFGRRVRSPEDLASALDAPLLAVIPGLGKPKQTSRGSGPVPAGGGFGRELIKT